MKDKTKQGMTVIHVVQHLAPGGLESLALDLLKFSPPKVNSMIISLEGSKQESICRWPKLERYSDNIMFLEKGSGVRFSIVSLLAKIFSIVKPDVVHTHHIGPLLYAGCAARLSGVACRIHTEHDAWHLSNTKHRRLQKWALKAIKPVLVADAQHVYQALKTYFSYPHMLTIKNGVDCEIFRPGNKALARDKFDLPEHATIVGCAGRLEEVKGQDVLLKALTLLPKSTLLVLAGEGSQHQTLQRLAQQLGIESQVRFLGLVDDMPSFYQALDTFCMPSRMEGFPLSPLEAQACNTNAVVTDVGAAPETLCPKSGELVKSGHVVQLAMALSKALNNNQVACPRDFVSSQYDIRHMSDAYHAIAVEALS